jgi:inner membrane transporter RhtA
MNSSITPSVIRPVIMVLVAIISIQTGASIAKQLFHDLSPAGVATLRLCFASLILACLCRPWRFSFTRQHMPALAAYGLSMGFMNLFIYLSLQYIPLGIAVALEFTGPLGVAICTSRRAIDFAWVLLAIAGIACLLPSAEHSILHWQGIAYALGAGLCWALYIIFGQKAGNIAHSGLVTSAGMIIAAMAITPIGIWTSQSALLNVSIWPIALLVALLSSAFPYYLEMNALRALPTKTFGVLMSMEPAVAAVSGFLILNEQLTLPQWLGIICIMLASLGATLSLQKAHGSPPLSPELQP